MSETLRVYRPRLAGRAAYWIRVLPPEAATPDRRRNVFLGGRGRLVIALRGGEGNPYRIRDTVVQELREVAYGARPLDFELLRKLASRPEALPLVRGDVAGSGHLGEAGAAYDPGAAESRLRAALFDPRGDVILPQVGHPDRPRAWLSFEIAEGMEAEPIARRVAELSGGGAADLVEHFPWDRANIHHPSIHAQITLARELSGSPEIWPSSPWPTPSGLFTRGVGVHLSEWGIPIAQGSQVRFPPPADFATMADEAARLLRGAITEAP